MRTWADEILPQLLMEQFDTLPSHYRNMDVCVKKFDVICQDGRCVNLDEVVFMTFVL